MTDDLIDGAIAALNAFEPTDYDAENVSRLYEIFADFHSLPNRARVMPAIFALLERFPDAEFGSPGPLVHELEAIPGYEPLLRESLSRQPTYHTVWMASRILNTRLPEDQREAWLSALRAAGEHPLARQATRDFLEHQRDS
jgi:hypothetical protein